ncbi:hypothetical protein OIU76_025316 [Salix suchowensis]|nr:hypothetical protein OIU76_025316 [Salix suchowensis]
MELSEDDMNFVVGSEGAISVRSPPASLDNGHSKRCVLTGRESCVFRPIWVQIRQGELVSFRREAERRLAGRREKELRRWGLCCSAGGRGCEDSGGRAATGGWEEERGWSVGVADRR